MAKISSVISTRYAPQILRYPPGFVRDFFSFSVVLFCRSLFVNQFQKMGNFSKSIPGYENRFRVKPGLLGYAQLFTPHSAPKRIRSFIDGKLIYQDEQLFGNAVLVMVTSFFMSRKLVTAVTKFLAVDYVKLWLMNRIKNQRALERITQQGAKIYGLDGSDQGPVCLGVIEDMNTTHVKFRSNQKVDIKADALCLLEKELRGGRLSKKKKARCRLTLVSARAVDGEYVYLARYQPVGNLNHYKIDQYFLEFSIIPPWKVA